MIAKKQDFFFDQIVSDIGRCLFLNNKILMNKFFYFTLLYSNVAADLQIAIKRIVWLKRKLSLWYEIVDHEWDEDFSCRWV